ncbi:MAG TPA: HPr family phosphocarrier protein [Ruminococcus sp.]|nr:HPr family phosphocarrier protein [Ruminococcus sp.]
MVSKNFTIKNKMGFHMRPANVFVTEMTKFTSDVNIIFGGKTINGKSIMNIMAGCIKCGSEITVECSGDDENAMLEKASELIENGFGEE